jgi:L-alanine-DL-glutamate epimerase-like enolase superfamily enzyme
MLGGACRDQLTAYASLPRYQTAEQAVEVAVRCVESGYRAIKLHQRDIESVEQVRKEVGDEITLMVDVNGLWTPRRAVEKIKQLEPFDVLWIEEPVKPMDDYEGLAFVKSRSNIWVAAGENEYTHYGFKEIIDKQAVDILQPDVTKSGGLMVCRKILALAEAWNLQLVPHCYYFGPGVAATLHFAASNRLSDYVEIHAVPLEASFIQPSLRPVNGFLKVPDQPGLGIEIDEEVVKKYPYTH